MREAAGASQSSPPAEVIRFGSFEVDTRSGELRRGGVKIRLSGQPFDVLITLLEKPGEVVTREELQAKLWPQETFVDFEHGLNKAVNKLREALGDDADNPRFIETLPRRGYRFLAPVTPARPGQPAEPAPAGRKIPLWIWPIIAVAALIVAWLLRPTLPPPQVTGVTQLTNDNIQKVWGYLDIQMPLATDGSRIYYQGIPTNLSSGPLMEVSTDGGDSMRINIPAGKYNLDGISPDGLNLLLSSSSKSWVWSKIPLWSLSLPGLQFRRMGNIIGAYHATAWSPNGKLLYIRMPPDYVAATDANGNHLRKLFKFPGPYFFWLSVSPDGRLLSLTGNNQTRTHTQLWEARTNGSHLRRILSGWNNGASVCCGSWTPDGKYFIFQSTSDGISSIWAIREAVALWHKVNHAPVRLTQGEMSAQSPLPGKDGKRVFFIGSLRRGEVMRYNLHTGSLEPYLPGFSATGLAFSKDGHQMVWASYPNMILWQSKADGSDRVQLTFPPMKAGMPRWSPDGSEIAFTAHYPGKPWQIYLVPSGGGEAEQLTSGNDDVADPSWSPDGHSLAYGGTYTQVQADHLPIRILNLQTHRVTTVPGSQGLFSPRWSPDGRYLLAMPIDGSQLMLYDFSANTWQQLNRGKLQNAAYPVWSPDGQCVYFNATDLSQHPEYRICLANRKSEPIANMAQAGNLAFGDFGWWTGVAPDGSILATRDTSAQEIYALNVKFP